MAQRSPTDVDVHVGARIRIRRSLAGMSQSALGDKLDVTFQQVQKYERGTNRVSASKLWLLAKVLEVPITYFFEGLEGGGAATEPAAASGALYRFVASPDGIALAGAFTAIHDTQVRRSVIRLCQTLAPVELSSADASKLHRRQAASEGVKAA